MRYTLRVKSGVDVEEATEAISQLANAEVGSHTSGDFGYSFVSADLDKDQLQKVAALNLFSSLEIEDTTQAFCVKGI